MLVSQQFHDIYEHIINPALWHHLEKFLVVWLKAVKHYLNQPSLGCMPDIKDMCKLADNPPLCGWFTCTEYSRLYLSTLDVIFNLNYFRVYEFFDQLY